MRLRTAILSATALVLSAPLLSAQMTTYDYTGNPLTNLTENYGGFYSATDNITGSLELANPLAANLSDYDIAANLGSADIVQWTFSVNGTTQTINSTQTPSGYSDFAVWTDGSGNLEYANVTLNFSDELNLNITYGPPTTGGDVVSDPGDENAGAPNSTASNTMPGTWTTGGGGGGGGGGGVPTGATPEPSSFVLMSTALLGFAFAARKQLVPRLLLAGRIAR